MGAKSRPVPNEKQARNAGPEQKPRNNAKKNGKCSDVPVVPANGEEGKGEAVDTLPLWPDPVDGASLLNRISAVFTKYLILPEGGADALAVWTLYSWVYDEFFVSPLLAVTSPVY